MNLKNILNIILNNKTYVLIFICVVVFHYFFWINNLGTNQNFQTLVSFYGSLGIILTVYSIYIQNINDYFNTINTGIGYFNQLFESLNSNVVNYFNNNDKLYYYYDELYNNNSNYQEKDRNKMAEMIITNQILTNIDSIVNYIDSFKKLNINNFQLIIAQEKLDKLVKKFMKSKIFKEHWKNFKTNFALNWTKDYIDLTADLF
jgi:hypothetical protein